jgi:hypothetical protein
MARVTEAEVKQLLSTNLLDEQVTPFLCAATTLIDGVLAGAGYTADELTTIERWLAAHFVAVRDPVVQSETIGAAAVTYHGKSDMGLSFTPYGQQVLLLEYKGLFAQLASTTTPAELRVLG